LREDAATIKKPEQNAGPAGRCFAPAVLPLRLRESALKQDRASLNRNPALAF